MQEKDKNKHIAKLSFLRIKDNSKSEEYAPEQDSISQSDSSSKDSFLFIILYYCHSIRFYSFFILFYLNKIISLRFMF